MTAITENGAPSLETTGDARVNLFFKLTRDAYTNPKFYEWIDESMKVSEKDTLKILFNGRDCRGGKGDRKTFINAMAYISEKYPRLFRINAEIIPVYGRYRDLIELYDKIEDTFQRSYIIKILKDQFELDSRNLNSNKSISLLAKWFPSENKKWSLRTDIYTEMCKVLFLTATVTHYHLKRLRTEYLTPMRKRINIVENHMCMNNWDAIKLSEVPSIAINKFRAALTRHLPYKFYQWIQDVRQGKSKINSAQMYPHQLVNYYLNGGEYDDVIEEQWKNLVKTTDAFGTFDNCLAICDTSGSMAGVPLQVSVALGILISSVATEPFRNKIITFSTHPVLHNIPDTLTTLKQKVFNVKSMHWEMSTNLEAVFYLILNTAKTFGVTQENMPKKLYIFSDMQFNEATSYRNYYGQVIPNVTNHENIVNKYTEAGYTVPEIIYWNLRSNTTTDFPVKSDQEGVSLLSGYSPSIIKNIMKCAKMTPYNVMREVIDDDRYSLIAAP